MRIVMVAVGTVGMLAATPALAQEAPAAPAGDASGYLCTIAGKCDASATPSDATPTRAAPATKGFRLAAAQQAPAAAPTTPAPTTRGFRLATGAPAGSQPTTNAPSTRGFRLATGTPAAARPATAPPTNRSFQIARPVGVAAGGGAVATVQPRGPRASSRRYAAGSARPAPASGLAVAATPRTDLMLTFDLNSAAMTPAAEQRARTFARALMMDELRGKRFLIAGHTDARGSRRANIELSRQRAQSVADFLVAQGVDRSRVEVRGVGPDEPLPGRGAAAESNRRVEAVLLS